VLIINAFYSNADLVAGYTPRQIKTFSSLYWTDPNSKTLLALEFSRQTVKRLLMIGNKLRVAGGEGVGESGNWVM